MRDEKNRQAGEGKISFAQPSMTERRGQFVSDWYYEKNGERGGPITADELKAMLASGTIGLANLVWTSTFGSEWKRISDTELAPPRPASPPPLPTKEPPALPPKPEQPAQVSDAFLDSKLTRALIGTKQEHYLGKWRAILAKANGDPSRIATVTSWNWPALFMPPCLAASPQAPCARRHRVCCPACLGRRRD
uniref:DUF4339 domain-containing protein n=1 Tax=Bosea sp. NBC_00436 TaxID=2969620 RepID=A0A9E8A0E7_9HYPH